MRFDLSNYEMSLPRQPRARNGLWILIGLSLLITVSFVSLNLKLLDFLSFDAMSRMGKFIGELLSPNFSSKFVVKTAWGALETLAMSALGTLLAAVFGLMWALPGSKVYDKDPAVFKVPARAVLNVLRSIPELVWAALLLIAVGLGPFAGTLALAFHTTGVLGRLFAESIENADQGAADALRIRGVSELRIFWYAILPQVLPQLISYSLYRWENNIRAAAVLGVVGAGGLGQMLSFHMGLFQMSETSTVLIAMILMVALVDALSYYSRIKLSS